MVITTESKNKVRDYLAQESNQGTCGTDGTAPTTADTDLLAADNATDESLTTTTGNQLLNSSYTLPSTIGNGVTYKEYGIYFIDGTLMNRVVFPDFVKTSSEELLIVNTIRVN